MKTALLALLFVVLTPAAALAHHHHHHHSSGSSGSSSEPPVCVRWQSDLALEASADAGSPDAGDAGEAADGAVADNPNHLGEHCVEWAPARGCGGTGATLLPMGGLVLAALAWRRRTRS